MVAAPLVVGHANLFKGHDFFKAASSSTSSSASSALFLSSSTKESFASIVKGSSLDVVNANFINNDAPGSLHAIKINFEA